MNHDLREVPLVPRRVVGAEAISALIACYRRSGLSLAEFARAERLPLGRLHYWLYQKHPGARPGGGTKSARVAPLFQELQFPAGSPLVESWAAEVNLPTGVAVRFNRAATAEWIGSVVQALQRPG